MAKSNSRYRTFGMLVLIFLMAVLSYWFTSHGEVKSLDVKFLESPNLFLSDQDVIHYLQKNGILLNGKINKEEISRIEYVLESNPYIDSAEVYLTKKNKLSIELMPLDPLVRVFMKNGSKSYYLNHQNVLVPSSINYTAQVPVVLGYNTIVKDSAEKKSFYEFAEYIHRDSFWNAQIQSIQILPNKDILLIPTLGSHKILLGKAENAKNKLDNLFEFYKQVMNNIGYDAYDTLDIRFDRQVLGRPARNVLDSTKI